MVTEHYKYILNIQNVDGIQPTQLNEAGEPEDWNFRVMIPAMMKVIQNQNERINTLEDTVNALNERLNKLKEMLEGVVK